MARITPDQIQQMKARGERIPMLTAYDYPMARILDEAGVPMLLVGDTLGMVVLGNDSTLPVTVDDIIRHTQAVVRGAKRALVIADLPFGSFQISPEETMRQAIRIMKEAGPQAVKLEGGVRVAASVRALVEAGIPVMGHVGMTPQSVNVFGGFKVQGRTEAAARALLDDVHALEEAGVFAIVLELTPAPLSKLITERTSVPTIGIGAGVDCDGEVQVLYDILGLFPDFTPRHTKRYADIGASVRQAAQTYLAEVRDRTFPTKENSASIDPAILEALDLGDEKK
ncbi:MAG TPA: 3-methyl-2-oxobutanoate hydroxymethyltransferase [Ktedonobacterales bacterium]|jgi:3-methyl-2-oxobutanoate hydroxymethyltransferase|nr:3-methyl-2-oxobutanoate hydroxymethyltransferase [Ktedonobacterales bacterium]